MRPLLGVSAREQQLSTHSRSTARVRCVPCAYAAAFVRRVARLCVGSYASLPQKGLNNQDRTEAERAIFQRALAAMGHVYASLTGTAVLQLKDIPPRPERYDGLLTIFGTEEQPLPSREALMMQLGVFGSLNLSYSHSGTRADACYATHAMAERAVVALKRTGLSCALTYNAAHYDRASGSPYRGVTATEASNPRLLASTEVSSPRLLAAERPLLSSLALVDSGAPSSRACAP